MKTERALLIAALTACALPLVLLFGAPTIPQDRKLNGTESERVSSLEAALQIDAQGQTQVVEQIKYDFNDHARPGLIFTLPIWKNLGGHLPKQLSIGELVVRRDGAVESITTQTIVDSLVVKTGTKQTLITGAQNYTLAYQAGTLVTKNLTGEERFAFTIDAARFGVPIDQTTITLQSPVPPTEAVCFVRDALGRVAGDCHIDQQGTHIHTEATRWLEKDQHLTVELAYPAGTFAAPLQEHPAPLIPAWLIIVALHLLIGGGIWFFFGRDARGRGVIIPNDEFLDQIKPYEAGTLASQWPTYASFLGLLLGAAQRKLITFERLEISNYLSYEIKRVPGAQGHDSVEGRVLKRLFLFPTEKSTSTEEVDTAPFDLQSTSGKLAYKLYEAIAGERLVERGWYRLSIAATFVYSILILIGWTSLLNLLLVQYLQDPHLSWMFIQIPLLLPVVYFLPRLTKEGALAREQVLGLKRYIQVAEKDRLAFHKSLEAYTTEAKSLHAYAVALGLQKDWMKLYFKGYKEEPSAPKDTFNVPS